jgi:hypothetical protein
MLIIKKIGPPQKCLNLSPKIINKQTENKSKQNNSSLPIKPKIPIINIKIE